METKKINPSPLAIAGLSISLFMMNLDTSIVSIGLPSMIKTLNTSFAAGQWFVLIYLLVLTSLITASGRLGDMIGKKRLYQNGLVIFTLASVLCGFSWNAGSLILFRGIQGLGAALILSLGMAIATELTPREQLGKIMGILSTVTALGIACGPTIGGLLLSTLGWPSMFLVNLPFGVLSWWLSRKHFVSSPVKKIVHIDWIGILLLAATLTCYCIGMTQAEKRGLGDAMVLILLGAAFAGGYFFIRFEKKAAHPLLNISIFKNKLISNNLIATFLVYTVIITTVIFPPFYLSKAAHYSPLKVGLVASFGPLLTMAFSVYAGKIADRYGPKNVMFLAVLTISTGCFFMSKISPSGSFVDYLWRIGIIAMGLNFFKTPNNTVIMEMAQPDQRGLLSSFLSLSRILGQVTGTAVMGAVFAVLSGVSDTLHDNGSAASITYGFNRIFLINTFLVLFAAALIYPRAIRKLPKFEKSL